MNRIYSVIRDNFLIILLAFAVFTLTVFMVSCKDDQVDYQGLYDSTSQELLKCLGGKNGDYNYCDNPDQPCSEGEGDCDNDGECSSGLKCGRDNGPNFAMPKDYEVCVQPHCADGIVNMGETGVDCGGECGVCQVSCDNLGTENTDYSVAGAASYCTASCPCEVYQGDCDLDSHCKAGLRCARNSGARFGLASREVCLPAHCVDGLLSGDETTPDCGGACGTCL